MQIAEMLLFISSVTGLPVADMPEPVIEITSPHQMRRACRVPSGGDRPPACAVMSASGSTIYISNRIDLDGIDGQALLLHEYVHVVQYHAGVFGDFDCHAEADRDAHAVQLAFLESVDADTFDLRGRGWPVDHEWRCD